MIGNTHVLHGKIGVWKKRFEEVVVKELANRQDTIVVEALEDVDRSSALNIVRGVVGQASKAIVLIARKYDSVCVVCGASSDVAFDYEALFEALSNEYRLKGGREEHFIYGEGLYKESIVTYCKEYVQMH